MVFANMFHIHDLKLLIFQMCGFSEGHENDTQVKVSDYLFVVVCIFYMDFGGALSFLFFLRNQK